MRKGDIIGKKGAYVMNFNKKFIKGISLSLLILMLIPTMPSYAATYKDVKEKDWAYEYIEKMSKVGYIKGDPDGRFRPSDNLTYLEVLSFVSRVISVTDAEKQNMRNQYQTLMTLYNVPAWAQDAVMSCLYKGVISQDELKYADSMGAIKTGTTKRVNRIDTSVFLAKAMELDKLPVNSQIGQVYKDLKPEHEKYKPLLYLLIDAKVLSPEGMGNYEFKPNNPVKREQMAKMISMAYDYLQANPQKTPDQPQNPIPNVGTDIIQGSLYKITNYGNNTYFITIKNKNNKETAYLVDSKTSITLDGKSIPFSNLYEGQDIEITVPKDGNTVNTIKATSVEEKLTGNIKYVYPAANRIVIEYKDNKNTKTAELTVAKDADITLDGKDVSLVALEIKDEVNIISKNNVVSEIEAVSASRDSEGVITKIDKDSKGSDVRYYITIEDSKGNEREFEVDSDADVYRNGKKARIEDLRVQDEVEIELEYSIIVDINAEVVEKDISGQIIIITDELNRRTQITILNRKTNKEEIYTLARDAKITIDKTKSTSFDLRKGFYVDAVVGSDEILEIKANSAASQSLVRGKIKRISNRNKEIDLEVYSSDIPGVSYGDTLYVKTSKDTIVGYGRYYDYDLDYLGRNDEVDIYGYYDGYSFIADEINIR